MTPDEALRLTGGFTRGARIVRRLHASPVKQCYLVERRRERFVLRVDEPLALRLRLDRAAEAAVLNVAWRAGFAPQPIEFAPGPPALLVTRFVPGQAWSAADLRDKNRLRRLAGILRRLHEARLPGPELDLGEACARYAALAGTAEARALSARAARLLRRWAEADTRPCLCHNDPLPGNVIGLRRPVLIDWEYAGVGHPLFDVAAALQHHRLSGQQVMTLSSAYFGAADRVPWEALGGFRELYDAVRGLWTMACGRKKPRPKLLKDHPIM